MIKIVISGYGKMGKEIFSILEKEMMFLSVQLMTYADSIKRQHLSISASILPPRRHFETTTALLQTTSRQLLSVQQAGTI